METASTRGDRPKLREALGKLQADDTLVIYKPDRVARPMKELLVLLEDQLHARGVNPHILTVYRFRTHRGCCDLLFAPMSWLRQDRGLCPFACST